MSSLDKFFIFFGKVVFVAVLLYLMYRFLFKPYYMILPLDIAKQLGF
jgi:hypothetical protein